MLRCSDDIFKYMVSSVNDVLEVTSLITDLKKEKKKKTDECQS